MSYEATVIRGVQPAASKARFQNESIQAYVSRTGTKQHAETHDIDISRSGTAGFVFVKFGCQQFWCHPDLAARMANQLLAAAAEANAAAYQEPAPKEKEKDNYIMINGVRYAIVKE